MCLSSHVYQREPVISERARWPCAAKANHSSVCVCVCGNTLAIALRGEVTSRVGGNELQVCACLFLCACEGSICVSYQIIMLHYVSDCSVSEMLTIT